MGKNTYTLVNQFECCGKMMVTVIIKGRVACIMSELDFNRIIETERKYLRNNRLKRSAQTEKDYFIDKNRGEKTDGIKGKRFNEFWIIKGVR